GPLRGVPVLVKNLGADVAGQPATDGSRLFADVVAEVDCAVVQRYKAAGMVVLGTTNVPELGKTTTTEPLLYGPCRNPWDTGYSTGGSSGGSGAAVASGMVPVAHGTDGGGSIRIPASAGELVGLKPSRGRVPGGPRPDGLASPVTYHHALTTSVRDSAPLLDAVAGHAPGGAFGAPTPARPFLEEVGAEPGRLRIGVIGTAPGPLPTDPVTTAAVDRPATPLTERRDSAALLDAVAGHAPGDAFGAPTPARPFLEEVGAEPGRLRIGVIGTAPDPFPTDPVTTAAVDRTATLLTELGHEVRPIELGIDITESMAIAGRIMMAQLVATVDARLGALGRELADDDLEPWTRTMLDNGRTVTGTDLNLALQGAQRIG